MNFLSESVEEDVWHVLRGFPETSFLCNCYILIPQYKILLKNERRLIERVEQSSLSKRANYLINVDLFCFFRMMWNCLELEQPSICLIIFKNGTK